MKRVLCFGDSNTWGYIAEGKDGNYILRYPEHIRWPGALKNALGSEWEVLEEGLCGRTSAFDDPVCGGRNGLEALRELLGTVMPIDALIVALGINDLKEAVCGAPESCACGIGSILDYLQNEWPEAFRILIVTPASLGSGIFGPPFAPEFARDTILEDANRLACLQAQIARDHHTDYLEAAKYAKTGPDGLHLTKEGHQRLAGAISAWLLTHL